MLRHVEFAASRNRVVQSHVSISLGLIGRLLTSKTVTNSGNLSQHVGQIIGKKSVIVSGEIWTYWQKNMNFVSNLKNIRAVLKCSFETLAIGLCCVHFHHFISVSASVLSACKACIALLCSVVQMVNQAESTKETSHLLAERYLMSN